MSQFDFCYQMQADQVPFSTIRGGRSRKIETLYAVDRHPRNNRPMGQVNWILRDLSSEKVFAARKVLYRDAASLDMFLQTEVELTPDQVFETLEVSAQSGLARHLCAPEARAQHMQGSFGIGAGTKVMTVEGEVSIEDIKPGDLVVTRDHGMQPVRWVGGQECRFGAVKFTAGAIRNSADIYVCPNHRLLLSGPEAMLLFANREVLIPARHFVNGDTVVVEPERSAHFFHVLLDQPELIYCEASTCESLVPAPEMLEKLPQDMTQQILAIKPDLSDNPQAYGTMPRWYLDVAPNSAMM